jgi:Ran GTPase-activating protein (RanGAP) involved in mRNA processing and transport
VRTVPFFFVAMDVLYSNSCHLLRGHADQSTLAQLKQEPPIKTLDITRTYIGPLGGFDSFLAILPHLKELESLDMSFSVLSTDNIRDLAEVLKSLKSLKSLKLRQCKLYVESANHLLSLLRVNRSIAELDFSDNDIPAAAQRKLRQMLEYNQKRSL